MSSRNKTFLGGCLGCFGLAALAVVVVAAVTLWPALGGGPDPEPVQRREAVPWNTLAGDHEGRAEAEPTLGGEAELGGLAGEIPAPEALPPESAWTVDLDLSLGEFMIEPAAPGEGFSVEADYDQSRFRFEQEVDEGARSVRVRFGQKGSVRSFFFGGGKADNRVTIRLPRGVPLRLVGELGVGETRAELGGLHLTTIDLDANVGDHALRFSEPTTGTLERLDLTASVGEMTLHDVGNASPERLTVHQNLGEMLVDLHGAWRNDGAVTARLSLGECTVVVPEDVAVDVERLEVSLGGANRPRLTSEAPDGAPRLTLDVQGSLGEVTVRH